MEEQDGVVSSGSSEEVGPVPVIKARLPVGRVLGSTISIYFKNFFRFLLIGLIFFSPYIALSFSAVRVHPFLDMVLWIIMTQFISAAIIYGVFRRLKNESAGIGSCLAVGFRRFLPLVLLVFLTWLIVFLVNFAPMLLAVLVNRFMEVPWIGAIIVSAALIPGLCIYLALFAAPPVLVVERKGVQESFRRSQDLTRGNRLRIFLIFIVILIVWFLFIFVVGIFFALATGEEMQAEGSIPNIIFGFCCSLLFSVLAAVASAIVYYHLKMQVDGMDESELAAVFD